MEKDERKERDQDRFELEVREIQKAVNNLMNFERSFTETDLILTIRSAAELLLFSDEETKE